MYFKSITILVISCLWAVTVHAKEVAGVAFEDSLQTDSGGVLVLNGVGIRKLWMLKIYAAGLYLPETTTDVETVLNQQGPRRVRMVFLYRKVSEKKLAATFDKGFKANHSEEEMKLFADKLGKLKSLFKTVRKGDEVVLDYIPDVGTHIYGNGELQGVIPGFEFNRAILRVWLGDKPADKNVKKGFLGVKSLGV